MDVYLINLDRSPERLQFFQQQADALGVEFKRLSAVDGRKLSKETLAAEISPEFEFQPVNAGETGLFMSHKAAWQLLRASGKPHAAVFEDDVQMSLSMRQVLDAIDGLQQDFDIIKLETTLRRVVCSRTACVLRSGDTLQPLLSWHGGTAGYVISAAGAGKLLQWKQRVADPVDQVMFNPMSRFSSRLKILQLNPAACIQKDILDAAHSTAFGTTIDRHVTGGKLFRHGPLIDMRRMLKKQFERQRRHWLALQKTNVQAVIPFEKPEQMRRAS